MAAPNPTQNWGSPSFTSAESFALLWQYVRYFISEYMPFIMIVVAIFIAWGVASLIVQVFTKDRDDDDDDPVEYM